MVDFASSLDINIAIYIYIKGVTIQQYRMPRNIDTHIVSWGGESMQTVPYTRHKNQHDIKTAPILGHYFAALNFTFLYDFKMLHFFHHRWNVLHVLHEYNFALANAMVGLKKPMWAIFAKVQFITGMKNISFLYILPDKKYNLYNEKLGCTDIISSTQYKMWSTELKLSAAFYINRAKNKLLFIYCGI